ncbi:MAG: hypothetical protein EA428_07245 [Spirochaetaceae bacterium]|nr:MAG: hypothetical protein EA428_07245 [Spirochaetaceae bacterium]
MTKITAKVLRADAKVGTAESKRIFNEVLPSGSYVIVKPGGSDARSDMEVGTLREVWAAHESTTADSYRDEGSLNPVVQIKPNGAVGTLRDRLARAMGLPPASVELRMPDGSKAKPTMRFSTFTASWKEATKAPKANTKAKPASPASPKSSKPATKAASKPAAKSTKK